MTTMTDLEERLRRGLQSAGDALPPASHEPPTPSGRGGDRRARPSRRSRWVVGAAAMVMAGALATVVVTVASSDGRDREPPAVRSAAETTEPPTTAEAHQVRPTNGMVPGQAVAFGNQLRIYGPDGAQTGSLDLSRFDDVQAASSDLDGGWVVCGSHRRSAAELAAERREIEEEVARVPPEERARAEAETGRQLSDLEPSPVLEELVWYPDGGEPEVLVESPMCAASSIHVIDSAEGPMLVYETMGGLEALLEWRAIVLATGEERDVPIAGTNELLRWSVTSDRFLTHGPDGFHLYDLATGDPVPMAPIDVDSPSDIVLSGDGSSVAVITGDADGPSDVTVYDVASGAQRYTEHLSMATEGAQLSYDGTTLAFGNYYEDYGPATVVDLASGARHTIDAHGVLL
jgi:hypothetical protein